MKQYTIIHPLYMAFYSKSLYREVAREWSTRLCFLYLLSLVALCWIPGMIRLNSDVTYYVDNDLPKYVSQLPTIIISKGQASIAEPQPYIIKDPENGEPVMIIDTTGQITSLEKSTAHVLLTKTALFIKEGGQSGPVLQLSEIGDMTVDKTLVYEWLETFAEWFAILMFPFAVLFSFVFRVIQVLIYGLAAKVFLYFFKLRLDFWALIRICAVAMTPLIIFNALVIFLRISFPLPWLVNSMIATGYLLFAIRANMQQAPR